MHKSTARIKEFNMSNFERDTRIITRVAAYCRVSTDMEDQQGSLAHQKQYFSSYIDHQPDWRLIGVFSDEGSGTSTNRPGFQKMLEAAYSGEIDLILTKEVSRFARNTMDTLSHTRELRKCGVGVIFINDNIDTRQHDGEFRLTIMASVAQEESRKTSERVKWGQKRSMENGVVFGCNNMYGYNLKDGKLTVRPAEAEVIRHIYHKFLDEGKGTHVIARELYEEGIAPPKAKNKPWSSVMILRILRSEKYCGDLLQKKSYTPSFLDHKRAVNTGQEEQVYIRGHHEAIIPRDMYERVQAELMRRSPMEGKRTRYSSRYWCSGKIICGECGCRFVPRKRQRADGSEYFYWVCHAKSHFGKRKIGAQGNAAGCGMHSINNVAVNACMCYIMDCIQMDKAAVIDSVLQLLEQSTDTSDKAGITHLQAQRDRLLQKKDAVLDAYFDQTITKADMERLRDRYNAEMARIDTRLDKLEQEESRNAKARENLEGLRKHLTCHAMQSEAVWMELLEKMTVYSNHAAVKLSTLTMTFLLQYAACGKGENYHVQITKCEF